MAARIQLTLAGALLLIAIALAGVLVLGGGGADPRPGAEYAVGPGGFAGAQDPALPVRDFTLEDERGRTIRLSADRGHVVVMTFMYSTCRDTCPVIAQQIKGALDDLHVDGDQEVPAYAISVDPKNDTPHNAQRFLLRQTLTGRMHFLLGSRARLAPVWETYHVQPQGTAGDSKAFDHTAIVLVIDKHGRERVAFQTSDLIPAALAHDIAKLRRE